MRPPAFQFYATDWISNDDVLFLTLEQEGAYIRLLAYCWINGSIPNDDARLSVMTKGSSTTVLSAVKGLFVEHQKDSSKLIHKRLDLERQKQEEWRGKCRKGGLASGSTRRSKAKSKGSSTNKGRVVEHLYKTKTKSKSKSKSKRFQIPPERKYVVEYSKTLDPEFPESEVDHFLNHHEARDWVSGRSKIKDWQAALRTWNGNRAKFGHKGNGQGTLPLRGREDLGVLRRRMLSARDERERAMSMYQSHVTRHHGEVDPELKKELEHADRNYQRLKAELEAAGG